jgi:hypothetical protein
MYHVIIYHISTFHCVVCRLVHVNSPRCLDQTGLSQKLAQQGSDHFTKFTKSSLTFMLTAESQSPFPASPTDAGVTVCPKAKWTAEEDLRLLTFGYDIRTSNWTRIAGFFPGRTNKQCRARFWSHLAPIVIVRPWTQNEDFVLEGQHSAYGNQWARMLSFLPGRSINELKTRWNWLSKQRQPDFLVYRRMEVENTDRFDKRCFARVALEPNMEMPSSASCPACD